MHDVQTLRKELADSRKKLQEYADTIVSLHGELRSLRESICIPCKQNFVPANLISCQDPAVDSSFVHRISPSQGPAEHTNSTFSVFHLPEAHIHASAKFPTGSGPPTAKLHRSPRTLSQPHPILSTPTSILLPRPALNTIHGNEKPGSTNALTKVTSSSRTTTPKSVPRRPCWSVRRDATADTALDVTFVCAFDHKDPVKSVRFSADGKYLAAVLKDSKRHNNGTIIIYDVECGEKICVLSEYPSQYSSKERPGIHCVCFSPGGRYLVFGDTPGRVTVWDIPNNRVRNIFSGHKSRVESVDFSPNGRLVVSASWDMTVRIWNMRDGSESLLTEYALIFTSVKFSPNGQFIGAGNSDGFLRIWHVRSGRLERRWTGHKSIVWSVAFMPDGNGLVSGGLDGVVKCWNVGFVQQFRGDPVPTKVLDSKGSTNGAYSIAVSPDARWIAFSLSNRMVIWDAHRAVPQCTLIGHMDAVSSVDFSPVGSYLALSSNDCHVTLWRYN